MIVTPATVPYDTLPVNNPAQSRPVLGADDILGLRRFGRPRDVAKVRPALMTPYLTGATRGEQFQLPVEDQR